MSRPAIERPVKVVAVAPNWLGDAVMCLPALSLLGAAPGVTLAVSSRPYTARVYTGLAGVDEVWVDPAAGRVRAIAARVRALRAYGADATVLFPPSFSSALPGFLAGTRHRVGFRADTRGWLLTDAPAMPGRDVHLARSYTDLAAHALARLGVPVPANARPPRLAALERERAALRSLLASLGIAGPGYAVVVPGAAFGPAKAWPWERYRELCARLAREWPVVVTGSRADHAVCERVSAGIDRAVNLAGRTGLGELFALFEGARVLVANDSGAPHVAAAIGVPVVVLFGSTSPVWTAPQGKSVEVLRHSVHCSPCFRRTCPTQLECFHGIEVDAVHRAALARGAEKAVVGGPGGRIESAPGSQSDRGKT